MGKGANGAHRPVTWLCPRCGSTVVVYVTASAIRCGCGAAMRPVETEDGELVEVTGRD